MTEKLEKEVDKETLTYLERIDSRDKNLSGTCENYGSAPKLDALMSWCYYGVI